MMKVTQGRGSPPARGRRRGAALGPRYDKLLELQGGKIDWVRVAVDEVNADDPARENRRLTPSDLRGREQAKWHNVARSMGIRIRTYTADNGDVVVVRGEGCDATDA